MTDKKRILIVEDNPDHAELAVAALKKSADVFETDVAATGDECLNVLKKQDHDIILLDYSLDTSDGMSILKKIRNNNRDIPVIIVTGMGNEKIAIESMKLGAYDYIIKTSGYLDILPVAVKKAIKNYENVTKRRKAEKELQQQNEFLNIVMKSLTHPFYVIDANNYTIKIANQAANMGSLSGNPTCYEMTHNRSEPCEGDSHRCPLREVKETKRPVTVEHIHNEREGNVRYREIHCYPIFDKEGKVTQVIEYCIDITDRKRFESIAEAENLMKNIGFVFSGIRHEIGNPINSIKMALSVLKKNLNTFSEEKVKEFVSRTLAEISRVEYLLRTLKNFSLYETPNVQNVQMSAFIEKFLPIAERDLKKKGIRIKTKFSPEAVWGLTDPRALQQVMMNLMVNAAEALEGSDDPRIDISLMKKSGLIQICMQDNGCGMTKDQQNNLFKPFITSKPHGTGLGLVLVKKMLSNMNSTIEMESQEDVGTKAIISIPERQFVDR